MTTARDSLYVHGNMPCPTPVHSGPPSRTGISENQREYQIMKAIKHNSMKAPPPLNTEEELRNILRQAKPHVVHGPTQVAKRNEYFKKIKHLNDGMYGHNMPPLNDNAYGNNPADHLMLEGKRVEDEVPVSDDPMNKEQLCMEFVDLDGRETMHSAVGMPIRGIRSSANSKSAKSFKSFFTTSSDPPPRPSRSITLPQLTIGSTQPKTRGQYVAEPEPISGIVGNAIGSNKENLMDSYVDFRYPSPRPRRILRGDGDRTPGRDITGNYGSMSLDELKACLHINRPKKMKSEHQEYLIQDYLTQFKQAQEHAKFAYKSKGNAGISPKKPMTTAKKSAVKSAVKPTHVHPSPRYEFKTVESYLNFNKQSENQPRATEVRTATVHGQSAQAQAYSDTLLLKMMTDLNKPAEQARQSANMAAVRLLNADQDLTVNRRPPQQVPCNSPVYRKAPPYPASGAPKEKTKEIIQHIVYVPSGQTAKVRLLKS